MDSLMNRGEEIAATRRTSGGGAKVYTFEVGPLEVFDFSPAEIKAREIRMRRDMDKLLRSYMAVGPRSKVVKAMVRDA